MIDKIWEFFTSDDKVDRLLTRAAVVGFAVLVFIVAYNISAGLLVALGVVILGAVIFVSVINRSDKKAEEKWQKLLNEEDDGVTGYIAVRPEELEGPPWEVPKPKPKQINPDNLNKKG